MIIVTGTRSSGMCLLSSMRGEGDCICRNPIPQFQPWNFHSSKPPVSPPVFFPSRSTLRSPDLRCHAWFFPSLISSPPLASPLIFRRRRVAQNQESPTCPVCAAPVTTFPLPLPPITRRSLPESIPSRAGPFSVGSRRKNGF